MLISAILVVLIVNLSLFWFGLGPLEIFFCWRRALDHRAYVGRHKQPIDLLVFGPDCFAAGKPELRFQELCRHAVACRSRMVLADPEHVHKIILVGGKHHGYDCEYAYAAALWMIRPDLSFPREAILTPHDDPRLEWSIGTHEEARNLAKLPVGHAAVVCEGKQIVRAWILTRVNDRITPLYPPWRWNGVADTIYEIAVLGYTIFDPHWILAPRFVPWLKKSGVIVRLKRAIGLR